MSLKCNVIICESQRGFSTKLREYFQVKGVTSHLSNSIKGIGRKLRSLALPIVLIELPDRTNSAHQFLKELVSSKELHDYPLIVIGNNARSYENYLNETFKRAANFNKPFTNQEILEVLHQITESFEFPKSSMSFVALDNTPQATDNIPRVEEDNQTESTSETELIQTESSIPASELYSSFDSIPQMFFEELNKFNLLSKNLRGKEYISYNKAEEDKIAKPVSQDAAIDAAYTEMYKNLPKLSALRFNRIAFMSKNILDAVCTDGDLAGDAKEAAVLFNWCVTSAQKFLACKDYLSLKSKSFRKELCSKIKDSAMKCALELKKERIAEIISKVGKIIGCEDEIGDDPISVVASTIAAVDMIDRACWQNNHFSPRAAYKIMSMAKAGELSDVHPAVLCCIIKILSEAMASNIKVLMLPREMRNNPALLEEAQKKRDVPAAEGEKKVDINELTPGMKLSRPLIAFDGREILEEDMTLDQDLIWRIWQLSLVRPLNSPLIIEKDS